MKTIDYLSDFQLVVSLPKESVLGEDDVQQDLLKH
jgi:hypothetical protein